jgi:hypothetical protein
MNNLIASVVNLNNPGHYLNWSIFTISVANLVIIAVMIVIFGLALLIPFPKRKDQEISEAEADRRINQDIVPPATSLNPDSRMWTAKLRRLWLRVLPPSKLLPDRQPAYVSSWIYVFGVASLCAFAMCIISGFGLAIGGPDWWHMNPIGHFFNSMHLWSVEIFMAFLVIHMWGKFWMSAWRGNRKLTWMTGVIAFLAAILECFTGYISQQNFDSQWIATNGKDAINATGLGTFFNIMDSGQMLMWHILLIPIILIALIGGHILLVRMKGVSSPMNTKKLSHSERRALRKAESTAWRGPTRRYDILKEGTIAFVVVFLLVIGLSAVLSSPNYPPVTVTSWSKVAPADFMATTASELAGTSETANYGPPYNNGSSNVQKIIVSWQMLDGVHQSINSAQTFVLSPLSKIAPIDKNLNVALNTYNNASSAMQQKWNQAYLNAVANVEFNTNGTPIVPKTNDGPVPVLVSTELTLAQSGVIDADLLAQQPFYGTNYTKPLLFIEDGNYFSSVAHKQHLEGSQWGVMNETGSYPGQPWMWLYTLWYQVPGFSSSANVDLIAIYLTAAASLILLSIPFIPGLRDIPRLIPIHRLIWRDWNRKNKNKN